MLSAASACPNCAARDVIVSRAYTVPYRQKCDRSFLMAVARSRPMGVRDPTFNLHNSTERLRPIGRVRSVIS
jgi:hypothetical protein